MMNELMQELRVKIIETLHLMNICEKDITADEPLVGGGLGLDSIDVLELVMMIEKDYGVKIDNKELGIKVFASLNTLADYIYHNRLEKNI
jgi:acyl carrier protein